MSRFHFVEDMKHLIGLICTHPGRTVEQPKELSYVPHNHGRLLQLLEQEGVLEYRGHGWFVIDEEPPAECAQASVHERACKAFDVITACSFYALRFRSVLRNDQAALEAAEILAAALRQEELLALLIDDKSAE
jgi:hypothetical protein